MKGITVIAAGLVLLASGCASHPVTPPPAVSSYVDTDKVALVNRVATSRGVEVHWVNYPLRRTPSTGT